MFSLLNGVYDSYLAPTELNILVVGASRTGKTTLLERIKVTQMPKRANQADDSPVPLTVALHDAFAKGGAEVSLEGKASFNGADGINSAVVKTTQAQVAVPVVIKKRRFKLSICPAPSRYAKTAQDQDEVFLAEDEPDNTDASTSDKPGRQEEEVLASEMPASADAPLRARSHSKEFSVKNLDIVEDKYLGQERLVSMESIPLDDAQATISMDATNRDVSLRQEKFEEYHLRPKAKMLTMSKIRPTSKPLRSRF